MTCCTAFVHECSPSRPSSALCGPPAGRWGSIPGRITAGRKRQLHRHGPEILAQAPAATCRCRRLNGRRCAFSPPPRSSTWPRPFMPATGRWCLWAPTAPADRGLAGLRPSRVDLLAGAVTVAETLTEVKGKLIAGPPKTRAGRRTVGLPPFVVRELEEHLAAAQRPGSHVFTAAGGGRCGSRVFGALLGAGYRGSRPAGPAHPRPSPHRRGAVDRRRRDAQGGRRARGTPRSASPWTAMATRRSPGWSRRAGAIQ
jgi:hypothetical protein